MILDGQADQDVSIMPSMSRMGWERGLPSLVNGAGLRFFIMMGDPVP